MAVYYATKAYVSYFSNAIAQEVSGTNVIITTLMPGATDTEFAKTADMTKTSLFSRTVKPEAVAKDGYNAMLKGKLEVFSGVPLSQKILFAMMPLIPKKVMLKEVFKMQNV